jgi:hypothetical protein
MFTYQPISDFPRKPPAFDGKALPAEKTLCDVGIIYVTLRDKRNP